MGARGGGHPPPAPATGRPGLGAAGLRSRPRPRQGGLGRRSAPGSGGSWPPASPPEARELRGRAVASLTPPCPRGAPRTGGWRWTTNLPPGGEERRREGAPAARRCLWGRGEGGGASGAWRPAGAALSGPCRLPPPPARPLRTHTRELSPSGLGPGRPLGSPRPTPARASVCGRLYGGPGFCHLLFRGGGPGKGAAGSIIAELQKVHREMELRSSKRFHLWRPSC